MRITRLVPFFMAVLPLGCLEMPVTHLDKTEDPVVGPDASDDSGMGPQAACFACMAAAEEPGPGCQTPFKACKQDTKCDVIIACGFERQCFQGSKRAFLNCGLPCVSNGGVLTPDDPTLTLASSLFQCLANGPCGAVCFSSE
jgi:hypothetical protein